MHLPHNPTPIPFPSPHFHRQILTNLTFILSPLSPSLKSPKPHFPSQPPSPWWLRTIQEQEEQEPNRTRSYWRWRKQDFFPEPSFSNLTSYKASLSKTCPRLKDHLLDRSTDAFELVMLRKASENSMCKCLTWWDLLWLSFRSVVGSGIFTVTGLEAHDVGPSTVVAYAVAGLSTLLSSFCYIEFVVEIPVTVGSFSYLRVELGNFIAFIAASNILLKAVVGSTGLGRSWSSYLASLITNKSDLLLFKFYN